jgi:chemotaxis protein methyltransferase CheR
LVLAELGRDEEAVESVQRALYLDRGLAIAHVVLGSIEARRGDAEAARRSLRNALRIAQSMPADAPVPMADGQSAGRLVQVVSAQLLLLETAGR